MRRLVTATALCTTLVIPVAAAPAAEALSPAPMRATTLSMKSLPKACQKATKGRVLCASQSHRKLWFVVNGKVVKRFDARFGPRKWPTRNGSFRVYAKYAKYTSRKFGSSMPYSMFFDRGRAVHFSANFKAVGYRSTSHGCINVRDYKGLQSVFAQVKRGDRVIVSA